MISPQHGLCVGFIAASVPQRVGGGNLLSGRIAVSAGGEKDGQAEQLPGLPVFQRAERRGGIKRAD